MKKIIPALTAIVLIVLIVVIAFGSQILEKYSYSDERADLNEYFNIYSGEEVPILLQDELMEEKAVLVDGVYYFDLATVHKYLNTKFYWDEGEGLLIFTTPTQVITSYVGGTSFYVDGAAADAGYLLSFTREVESEDEDGNVIMVTALYVAADYVKQYTNYSYEVFTEPNRMQIYTEWNERQVATVKKDTAVRYRGGVKSPILKDVPVGEKLIVLEQMETWAEVKTLDGFIGYVENKMLSDVTTETPVAVTDYDEPEYTSLTREHKISLGWHVIGGVGGNDTLDSAVAPTKGMNVISPTWFMLCDDEGNFTNFATKNYVNRAHDMGLEVWGLVEDTTYDVDIYSILSSTTKRNYLVSELVQAALDCGMDGINVDFETIGVASGPHYLQFIREMSIQCRLNNLVLSVDTYVPFKYNNYYDRAEQGELVDYVIIMGYDEHWHGSQDVGSVASIEYVRNGLENMTKEVPSKKVMNGLPLYTILWRTNGTEVTDDYVTMVNQDNLIKKLGMQPEWNEETCQNYGEHTSDDTLYQIWLEDLESIQVKLNVMANYSLGGVAVWCLGYEDPAVWDVISGYTN